MTTYAFSGVHRLLTPAEKSLVRGTVLALPNPTAFRFGGARGVDTVAAYAALEFWPDVPRLIIAPAASWSRDVPPGTDVEYAPEGRDDGDSYMIRNTFLVAAPTDVLVAFPEGPVEPKSPRTGGGTWATVRRARKRSLPIYVVPLDGQPPRWETVG